MRVKGNVPCLTQKKIKNRFIVQNDFRRIIIQLQFATNKIKIDLLERSLELFKGSERGRVVVAD